MVRARASMEVHTPTMEMRLSVPTGLAMAESVGTAVLFLTTKQAKLVRWLHAQVASPDSNLTSSQPSSTQFPAPPEEK